MDPKSLTADFRDFLKSLGDHGVDYLFFENKQEGKRAEQRPGGLGQPPGAGYLGL